MIGDAIMGMLLSDHCFHEQEVLAMGAANVALG
jgi:hypothetical protein